MSTLKALGTPPAGREAARKGRMAEMKRILRRTARRRRRPGIEAAQMIALAEEKPSALLCFERDPAGCHRTPLRRSGASGRRSDRPLRLIPLKAQLRPRWRWAKVNPIGEDRCSFQSLPGEEIAYRSENRRPLWPSLLPPPPRRRSSRRRRQTLLTLRPKPRPRRPPSAPAPAAERQPHQMRHTSTRSQSADPRADDASKSEHTEPTTHRRRPPWHAAEPEGKTQ